MSKTYNYRARDKKGRPAAGRLLAASREAAAGQLRGRGFYILDLSPVPAHDLKCNFKFWQVKVRAIDLALYSRQLKTMIAAGVPILSSLRVMQDQAANKKLALASGKLIKLLEKGYTFTGAVQQFPDIFPRMYAGMIKAGEEGGSLEQSLDRLAAYFEKEYEIREKIKTAITYPLLVAVISMAAVVLLLTIVLPGISQALWQQGVAMPLITSIVVKISIIFAAYWYLFILVFIAACFILKWAVRTRLGQFLWGRALVRMPLAGPLVININISRICWALSVLISSGITIVEALNIVKGMIPNVFIVEKIEAARADVMMGMGIAESLAHKDFFPPLVIQMVKVGEGTGELDLFLKHIAAYYERDANYNLTRLMNLMEPALIVLVSMLVGAVVAAVFLPLLKTIEAM